MNTSLRDYFRVHADHAILSVKLQPGARSNAMVGIEPVGGNDYALKIKLSAPPVDGKANAALLEYLSKAFDVPKSALVLVQGTTSRLKRVRINAAANVLAGIQSKLEEPHGTAD